MIESLIGVAVIVAFVLVMVYLDRRSHKKHAH